MMKVIHFVNFDNQFCLIVSIKDAISPNFWSGLDCGDGDISVKRGKIFLLIFWKNLRILFSFISKTKNIDKEVKLKEFSQKYYLNFKANFFL